MTKDVNLHILSELSAEKRDLLMQRTEADLGPFVVFGGKSYLSK